MVHDLRNILDGWKYEPGKISVRKIIGADGYEKIQTRVDLGLLQFEPDGRPDGRRPYGCDSLLDFFETRLDEFSRRHGTDEGFLLLPEDCRDLRHEAHLFYQRYLSFFVLEEYDGVERDTARNLRIIELCRYYAETEYDQSALESQWAYVKMMNTRARVYQSLGAASYAAALQQVHAGLRDIEEWAEDEARREDETGQGEMQVLESLRQEVYDRMPPDSPERLQCELDEALEAEDYERAAEIRDALANALQTGVERPACE